MIRTLRIGAGALLALSACSRSGEATGKQATASPERRAEVAEKGAKVMPFDLARTTHVFASLPDGGLQTVTAKDPGDTLQIRLIRDHLKSESERFARGDFEDPMAIHGHAMPGLAELRSGASRIGVAYAEVAAGAAIRYTARDPALIEALHRWFAAQRMDHGV
jgi:hypothetical protein